MRNASSIRSLLRSRLVFADGGFGSLLIERGFPGGIPEEWNLSHPDVVESIHADYFRAGCDYVHANTFGSNRVKLAGEGRDAAALDATRRLGITLTGANLMVPTKSVTAFVGVEPQVRPAGAAAAARPPGR